MIIFYLVFIDALSPILIGLLALFINNESSNLIQGLCPYVIFSVSMILVSFFLRYYNNYYSINFSEKLKISVTVSVIAIFIQLCFYSYTLLSLNLTIIFSWLLIPVVVLIIRYLIKISLKNIKLYTIYIIGNQYVFNKYEIRMLIDKGFEVNFYNSLGDLKNRINIYQYNNNVLVVKNDSDDIFYNSNEVIKKRTKINIIKLEDFMETYLRKLYLGNNNLAFEIKNFSKTNYYYKRLIDYSVSILLIPILIIVLTLTIILKVIYNKKDPLYFKQKRYGINKELFTIMKIRTMDINSDSQGNTIKNDSRIYPFAKWLRRHRFDELPQIVNVIYGHMHLVGPRAEWVKLSDEYEKEIKNYNFRHIVRPGITGWAQIIYPYGLNNFDAEQKLMYELYYIKKWSIWLELEICFKTIVVMLDKKGI